MNKRIRQLTGEIDAINARMDRRRKRLDTLVKVMIVFNLIIIVLSLLAVLGLPIVMGAL